MNKTCAIYLFALTTPFLNLFAFAINENYQSDYETDSYCSGDSESDYSYGENHSADEYWGDEADPNWRSDSERDSFYEEQFSEDEYYSNQDYESDSCSCEDSYAKSLHDELCVGDDFDPKSAAEAKRARDQKFKHNAHYQDLLKNAVQEDAFKKPSKALKRECYQRAQAEYASPRMGLHKVLKIANERKATRRQAKIMQRLNKANKDFFREPSQGGQGAITQQRALMPKPNSWQADSPEVLQDKRLQYGPKLKPTRSSRPSSLAPAQRKQKSGMGSELSVFHAASWPLWFNIAVTISQCHR